MPLYHVCPVLLAPGSVIRAGNYGRIQSMYVMKEITQVFFRERVLEQIRVTEFPNRPSRLSSAFCLETLQEAQFYRDNIAGRTQIIYEVELVDVNANRHRADYNKVQPQSNELVLRMEDVARDYWRGDNIQRAELVVATALRVVNQAA